MRALGDRDSIPSPQATGAEIQPGILSGLGLNLGLSFHPKGRGQRTRDPVVKAFSSSLTGLSSKTERANSYQEPPRTLGRTSCPTCSLELGVLTRVLFPQNGAVCFIAGCSAHEQPALFCLYPMFLSYSLTPNPDYQDTSMAP